MENAAGREIGRPDLPIISVPLSVFDTGLLKVLCTSIQAGVVMLAFGVGVEGSFFQHTLIDTADQQLTLYGDAVEILKIEKQVKFHFVGQRISVQKPDKGQSYGIGVIHIMDADRKVMALPLYMVAEDMAGLKKDPESCICPAWAARAVTDCIPTCKVIWEEVVVDIPAELRDKIGYTTGVKLVLPYLAPDNDVIRTMLDNSQKSTIACGSVEVIELTRLGSAARTGVRRGGGGKGIATIQHYFGSTGITLEQEKARAEQGEPEGEDSSRPNRTASQTAIQPTAGPWGHTAILECLSYLLPLFPSNSFLILVPNPTPG